MRPAARVRRPRLRPRAPCPFFPLAPPTVAPRPLPGTGIAFPASTGNRRHVGRRCGAYTRGELTVHVHAVPYSSSVDGTQVVTDQPRTYTVVLRPEPEGGFTVRVPALPEIVTYGEDEDEALAMAKEAIELCLHDRSERGEDIPDSDPGSGGVVVHSVSVSVAA